MAKGTNSPKPIISPMAATVRRLEQGDHKTANMSLTLEIGLFSIGCCLILAALFRVPLATGISQALVGLTGACLTGIGFTIRGMHRDAVRSAGRWGGILAAYADPALTEEMASKLDQIVLGYLERETRNGGKQAKYR